MKYRKHKKQLSKASATPQSHEAKVAAFKKAEAERKARGRLQTGKGYEEYSAHPLGKN